MISLQTYCVGVIVGFFALLGFAALLQRASRTRERLGSRVFINVAELLVGLGAGALWLLGIMPRGVWPYGLIGLLLAGHGGLSLVRELLRHWAVRQE